MNKEEIDYGLAIEDLQKPNGDFLILNNKKALNIFDSLKFIKNRAKQGASQKEIDKMAIELVKSYLIGEDNENTN